jgi:hypothetical protein
MNANIVEIPTRRRMADTPDQLPPIVPLPILLVTPKAVILEKA